MEYHVASTTSLFMIVVTSLASTLVHGEKKVVDWALLTAIILPLILGAFVVMVTYGSYLPQILRPLGRRRPWRDPLKNTELTNAFSDLSTPLVADACMRMKVPVRVAPAGIRPVLRGMRVAGRVLPARHRGSVDVFLEAMRGAVEGDVLVIDNAGRTDEACIGDLTVLEARAWGLSGLVLRGLHRDTPELALIGLPVFSYGPSPAGPARLDPRDGRELQDADWGEFTVNREDVVFGDEDGVVFVPLDAAPRVLGAASSIWETERRQANGISSGKKLSEQLDFEDYLSRRKDDPGYSFRKHLRKRGGAIEE